MTTPTTCTTGSSLQDAIDEITDAASGWLTVAEDEGLEIPEATRQAVVDRKENDILSLIQVDTIAYRASTDTRAVRKKVSLPKWMAALADKMGINCSQLLQENLMQKFNA